MMREDQLERSLRASAPPVSTVGVLDQVAHKRQRHVRARRAGIAVVTAMVLVATITLVAVATDDGTTTRIAAPAGAVHARVSRDWIVRTSPGVAKPGRIGPPEPEYHRPDA